MTFCEVQCFLSWLCNPGLVFVIWTKVINQHPARFSSEGKPMLIWAPRNVKRDQLAYHFVAAFLLNDRDSSYTMPHSPSSLFFSLRIRWYRRSAISPLGMSSWKVLSTGATLYIVTGLALLMKKVTAGISII